MAVLSSFKLEQLVSTLNQKNPRGSYTALCASEFLIEFGLGMVGVFLPVWMNRTITLVEIGIIGTITNLAGTLSLMFWGWFCHQFGRTKLVLASGLVMAGIIYPVYGLSHSFMSFLLLGIVIGIVRSMFYESAPLYALVMDVLGSKKMGKRYGIWRSWGTVGWVVAVILAGLLAYQFDFPLTFFLGGITYMIAAFSIILYVSQRSSTPQLVPTASRTTDPKKGSIKTKQRNLLVFTIASTLAGIATAVYGFFSLYMTKIGAPVPLIGASNAIGALTEVPVMILVGALSDRVGRISAITFGYLMAPIHLFLVGVLSDPYLVTAAYSLKGVSYGISVSVSTVFVAEEAEERRSLMFGLVTSLKSAGIVIGPYIMGVLAASYGMAGMFIIAAAYSLIPGILFIFGSVTLTGSQKHLQ